MTRFSRAGWLLSAAFFGTILSSIAHVDYVGLNAELLLLLMVIVAAARPDIGMILAVAVTPVAWYGASQFCNSAVAWPEVIVCAILTGFSLHAAVRARGREGHLPINVTMPAGLFGALVVASLIASLGEKSLRLGPGFTDAIVNQLTREYFVDVRGFPGLHAGMLLLEGILLFAAGARVAAGRAGDPRFLRRMAAAAAGWATLAAAINIARLLRSAWRGESFWATLAERVETVRWNVHYSDFNAAGSYFVMAALLAVALAASAGRSRRLAWTLSAVTIVLALWLTSSRVAMLAGCIAAGGVLLVMKMSGRRARMRAAIITAVGIAALAGLAVALPQRGAQRSSLLATDVRLGLLQTGARMIVSRPGFGVGLGGFRQRSAEYSSPELIAKFPVVASGENSHNNFVQVAAELGVAAGVLFTWLITAALVGIARRAVITRESFLLLTLASLVAFVLTWLGGHPLIIPEPGYVFWTMLGAATGSAAATVEPTRSRVRWLLPIGLIAIALTLPWRLRAMQQHADLEHVGIGVSRNWQTSPDGVRYREAPGYARLFVLAGSGFELSVYPHADGLSRLELKLDGRVADVVWLAPRQWNHLTVPARTVVPSARYATIDLRLVDADETALWITKVQPLR